MNTRHFMGWWHRSGPRGVKKTLLRVRGPQHTQATTSTAGITAFRWAYQSDFSDFPFRRGFSPPRLIMGTSSVFFSAFSGPEPKFQISKKIALVINYELRVFHGVCWDNNGCDAFGKSRLLLGTPAARAGHHAPDGGVSRSNGFSEFEDSKSARPKLHTGRPHPQPPIRPHPSGG